MKIAVGISQIVSNWEYPRGSLFAFFSVNLVGQIGDVHHLTSIHEAQKHQSTFFPLFNIYLHAHNTGKIAKELATHLTLVLDQAGHRGTEWSGTFIAIALQGRDQKIMG